MNDSGPTLFSLLPLMLLALGIWFVVWLYNRRRRKATLQEPNSPMNAICTSCKQSFSAAPKQSFLGFQKLSCPACATSVLYPLTPGYRLTYRIIFGLMLFFIVVAFTQGSVRVPGFLGIAVGFALWKDWSLGKRIGQSLP